MVAFEGFPRDFTAFFRELKAHNERSWFEENKPRYQESVVRPMMAFIEAMKAPLADISPHYLAIPRAHGGSMFRIYRDTRFSKDKTPYKTHAAAQFRHRLGRDVHAPGFYLHLGPDGVAIGGGIWRPPSPALRALREFIVDNPGAWRKIRDDRAVRERGGLQGDQLKRAPRGFDPEHAHIDDLRRKSFYVMEQAPAGVMHDGDFLDRVVATYRATAPLNHYVCDALELPFAA
ncbi:MAG: DUF2461 domain-containing protein [Xanthomonadales bacterium]|jgi:uncharacterized protein (TIGR02453 family)|nr:DUF2461 domain-containing protein [Xanthomonadales bacterium]